MDGSNEVKSTVRCIVAADLGASSGRVIAGQLTGGRLRLREVSRFPNAFSLDTASGYLTWPIDEIEAQVRKGIASAASLAPVASVGVDSWAVDHVLLDAQQQRIGGAVCYRDKRTEGTIERVCSRIPGAEIYRRTGIQFQPFNTIYQLAAVAAREPQWLSRACHLLMIPDYLHFRLCGVLSNEYTNASTTQMLTLNGEWDSDLFAAAGAMKSLMQSPVDAGTVLGEMKCDKGAIKVIAPASHDTASAVVGTPFAADTEAFLSSGTWSLMGIESLVPYASEEARAMNFSNEGGYGRRFRVLKNIMGLWILHQLCQEFDVPIDDALIAQAAAAAPWRSILNPNDARFLNPPSMKQAIQEYCIDTHQPRPESIGELTRCAFESLALSYRQVKEELESLRGRSLTGIRIVGGGSRNAFLNQLCANTCQLPVSAGPVEAATLGNICTQMIALGEIENIDHARGLIRGSFASVEFWPQEQNPDQVWKQFKQLAAFAAKESLQ
jgi:rhamnulokinase